MDSPSDLLQGDNTSDYDPLRLDHLYAIDLQNCPTPPIVDLEVDRFEEVIAEEADLHDWINYDEEHSYPRRPPINASVDWAMLQGWPDHSTSPTPSVPLLKAEGEPPLSPSVLLDVRKLELLFSEISVRIRSPHISTVLNLLNNTVNVNNDHADVINGPVDLVIGFLSQFCTGNGGDSASLSNGHSTVSIPVDHGEVLTVAQDQEEATLNKTQKVTTQRGRVTTIIRTGCRGNKQKRFDSKKERRRIAGEVEVRYRCPLIDCPFFSWSVEPVLTHLNSEHLAQSNWIHRCFQCKFRSANKHLLNRHVKFMHHRAITTSIATQTEFKLMNPISTVAINSSLLCNNFKQSTACPQCDVHISNIPMETEQSSVSNNQQTQPICWQNFSQSIEDNFTANPKRQLQSERCVLEEEICPARTVINREKPCICPDCGFGFSRSDVLLDHLRTRHPRLGQQLNHRCKYCGKGFKRKTLLIDHEQGSHEKKIRYFCIQCPTTINSQPRGFLTQANLRWHIRRKHEHSAPVFPCSVCGKILSSLFWLKKHLFSQHNLQLPDSTHNTS